MKYPIHVNDDFKKILKKHSNFQILNVESQSNDGIKKIIEFCDKMYETYRFPINFKVDVNIYHRIIKELYKKEQNGENTKHLIPLFPIGIYLSI